MRWWTVTVSPIGNRRSPLQRLAALVVGHRVGRARLDLRLLDRLQQYVLHGYSLLFRSWSGDSGLAAAPGLLLAPAGDGLVVAAEEDFGHLHAAEHPRAGVLGILEPAGVVVRLLGQALRVAQHARHVADHGVDDDHGRHFAAVAHEIADGNLARLQPLPDAFVEPLVPAAQQQQPLLAGQLLHQRRRQPFAGGRHHEQLSGRRSLLPDRLDAVEDRVAGDHHARPAPEGPIVHALVLAPRPVAEIPQVDLDQARCRGPA